MAEKYIDRFNCLDTIPAYDTQPATLP